jgi:hypothetical protein
MQLFWLGFGLAKVKKHVRGGEREAKLLNSKRENLRGDENQEGKNQGRRWKHQELEIQSVEGLNLRSREL